MVKSLPVRSVVAAVAAAAAVWCDRSYPPRRRTGDAIGSRMGYPRSIVNCALDRLFRPLTADALAAVIARELGSLDVLDGFVPDPIGRRICALPVGRVCIISSRTTIGVAIVPAIFALCAKCDVVVKDREDALVAAFFETLAAQLPALGTAAAQPWRGSSDAVDLSAFDAVVAFGTNETIAAIAPRLRAGARWIAYPSKISGGYLGASALKTEADARATARGAAVDMLLYEGEGCLSLGILFVERNSRVSPARVCEMLRDEIEITAIELPSQLRADSAARRALVRDLARFRGESLEAFSDAHATYLIVLDSGPNDPPFLGSRTLPVLPVSDPLQAIEYLERHAIALEALAVTSRTDIPPAAVARFGANRVTRFGALQSPPLAGFHGGRPRIAEFVRWFCDDT